MKKLEKERQFRKIKRLKWLIGLIVIVILSLAAAQLVVSNRLADLGEEIEIEKSQTETLASENRILAEELSQKESLSNITEEAKVLGFVEGKSIYYLVPQIPVAMK